jgi:hypothetical protein
VAHFVTVPVHKKAQNYNKFHEFPELFVCVNKTVAALSKEFAFNILPHPGEVVGATAIRNYNVYLGLHTKASRSITLGQTPLCVLSSSVFTQWQARHSL